MKGAIPEGECSLIRQSLQQGQLAGSFRFVDEIETETARLAEFCGQGRPSKTNKSPFPDDRQFKEDVIYIGKVSAILLI